MIDNEQQIDHAEHAAVAAEQDAERASELQHLALQSAYVRDLIEFGRDAHAAALAAVDRLLDEVTTRRPVNVHRYELLARWQHVALLAPTVANAIEDAGTYDLLAVASGVAETYRAQHTHPSRPAEDVLNRALAFAVDRVIEQVARTRREDEERFAAEAASERAVVEHEQYLASRDAL